MWDGELDKGQIKCQPGPKGETCQNNSIHECEFEIRRIKYHHFKDTTKYIYEHEGFRGFTKGVFPRMAMYVPSTALCWGTYEMIKSMIQVYSKE